MRVFCGVLASGKGIRFSNGKNPKQFQTIGDSTLFDITFDNIVNSGLFDSVFVALLPEYEKGFNSVLSSKW